MEKMTQEMIDSTFSNYAVGKTVSGLILQIKDNGLLINIGGKRDAFIYNEDIVSKEKYNTNDTIIGIIVESKDENGFVKVSNADYVAKEESKKIAKNLKVGEKIKFKVQKIVSGGVTGKLADFNIFVPNSEIDFANKRNLNLLLGNEVEVYLIQADIRNKKIVASIKKVIDEIEEIKSNDFWGSIENGQLVKGRVDKFTDYGAFININNSGFNGLLFNGNVGYLDEKAKDVLNPECEYTFIVLNVDKENKKIALGYKQLQDDPRIELIKKFKVGQEVKGKIIKLFTFGAVVEIEKNVTGFLHISEVEYGLNDMRDSYKINDEIDCKIIGIDENNFKISLSRLFKYDYEVQ